MKAHFVVQSGSVVHWRQKNRKRKVKEKKIKKKEKNIASLWLNKPMSKIIDSSKLYFKRIVVMGPD